jgi:hypothetical protein
MVAEDFLRDPQVRQWLGGIEPAWTLLTLESLRALRQEPSAVRRAIRIANDIDSDEVAASPMARNTLILLRHALEREGLALTATGNLTRAAVAEMRELIEWPDYDQAEAFQFHKVINEPDFFPLHVVRQLAQASNPGARTAREARNDTPGEIDAERRTAAQPAGDRVSPCLLAHGHGLFWSAAARVLAAGGRRHRALVALGLRQ